MIRLLLFAIAVLVAALCIQGVRLSRANSGEIRTSFAADSLQAARDTTRQLAFVQLHDSLTAFVRRATQQEQRADALDRALQASRLATLNAQVRVAALDTVIRTRTVSVPRDSLRRSGFSVRQAPYTIAGELLGDSSARLDSVSLPPTPRRGGRCHELTRRARTAGCSLPRHHREPQRHGDADCEPVSADRSVGVAEAGDERGVVGEVEGGEGDDAGCELGAGSVAGADDDRTGKRRSGRSASRDGALGGAHHRR